MQILLNVFVTPQQCVQYNVFNRDRVAQLIKPLLCVCSGIEFTQCTEHVYLLYNITSNARIAVFQFAWHDCR